MALQFTKLNSAVSIFTPTLSSPSPRHAQDPTTIIILQWMGASPRSRALSSIYEKYHALYPSARLISVVSHPEWFMTTSTSTRLSLISPVVSAILGDASSDPKMLVHLFSNGGSLAYVDICTLFKERKETFEVKGVVLDSAPGMPTLKEAWTAMSVGFPKGVLWYLAAVIAVVVIGLAWGLKLGLGKKSIVDETYEKMNDLTVVGRKAGRLYVYSEADMLVGWRDVERHMKEAKRKGGLVFGLKMGGTPHVQHGILEPKRYWGEVEEFWGKVGERLEVGKFELVI